jgi:hypothetical protein
VWKIRLTDAGRQLARRIDITPWELLRDALAALPRGELDALVETLTKVAAHVTAAVARS